MLRKDIKKGEEISPQTNNLDKLNKAKASDKKKKEKIKFDKLKIYIIIFVLIVLTVIVSLVLISYFKSQKYKEYIKYEDKMHAFGFDRMYNNQSAKTSESVTKSEAIRMAIAAAFNVYDISGFAKVNNEYPQSTWTEYAENMQITSEDININNYNSKVTYKDVISYFENCKLKFLSDLPVKDTTAKIKDISKYSADQQAAIKDMIANEIIYLLSSRVNANEYVFKGQVNEIVVNFVEKYNTIAMMGDKINVNPEKVPSNAVLYPYTLAAIDKTVYEKPLAEGYDVRAMSPKELYANKKVYYPQVQRYTEEFFNNILNIDYRTITEDSLKQKLEPYFIFAPNASAIKVYVKYVKDNEIILTGNSKLQIPVFYYDGITYRARVQLKFEIEHSKTKENLLYLDFFDGLKKTYEKTSYDILADYYLSNAMQSNNIYLDEVELYQGILDKDTCGITKEVDTETYFREDER